MTPARSFRLLVLAAPLVLAACATPRAQCEAAATRDLRILNDLIAETEAVLDRGYALELVEQVRTRVTFCESEDGDRRVVCQVPEVRTVERPVAVNLREEAAKLESLREKREEVRRRTRQDLSACAERFPETG